jgi:hypothetical protein
VCLCCQYLVGLILSQNCRCDSLRLLISTSVSHDALPMVLSYRAGARYSAAGRSGRFDEQRFSDMCLGETWLVYGRFYSRMSVEKAQATNNLIESCPTLNYVRHESFWYPLCSFNDESRMFWLPSSWGTIASSLTVLLVAHALQYLYRHHTGRAWHVANTRAVAKPRKIIRTAVTRFAFR